MADDDLRDAAYPEESGEAFVWLVKIEHDDLAEPIWLTDAGGTYDEELDTYVFTVGAQDYICAPIEIEPPGQSDEEPRGRLRVPNVDQRIGAAIEAIDSPATVTITAVLESDPTIVVGGPHALLKLQNIRGDAVLVEGEVSRPQLAQEPWPKSWIRPAKYLAAFRP